MLCKQGVNPLFQMFHKNSKNTLSYVYTCNSLPSWHLNIEASFLCYDCILGHHIFTLLYTNHVEVGYMKLAVRRNEPNLGTSKIRKIAF